jgi:hypothetical protein
MTRLSDIIDLNNQRELEFHRIEAYGLKEAPCLRAQVTTMRATEYMVKVDGKRRRVYNHEQENGNGRMYVKVDGLNLFLTEEADTMLTRGNPSYDKMTAVAGAVVVL